MGTRLRPGSLFLTLSRCTCQRNTRRRFLSLHQLQLTRRKQRRPRKEGRRKSSVDTFEKHCDAAGSDPPQSNSRQRQLTYLWQPLLTSNILCLAPHFFKVFYKHFSYQKPWLLVSEK